MCDSFSDPLLIAASFTHLEFSYRTIPLRRIRWPASWSSVRNSGGIFVKKWESPWHWGITGKKDEAILLTKIAPLSIDGSDLPQLWVRCSMDNLCEVSGLACGSFSLMGIYDRHLQNEENEPHSENEKMTVISKGSPPTPSEMIIISVILEWCEWPSFEKAL